MKKIITTLKRVPSWIVMLLIFGFLYFTGLHKNAVALLQRGFLNIGFMSADVPKNNKLKSMNISPQSKRLEEKMQSMDFRMKDFSGNTLDFASLKGKVIFLNLWATWCPPCRAEMPNIHSLYNEVASEDIVFIMLSLDKNLKKVDEFMSKYDYQFEIYRPLSNLPDVFQTKSIPSTFIISPHGDIVFQHEGMANYDTDEVKSFLQEMVKLK